MKRVLAALTVTGAAVAGMALTISPASAAHCTDNGPGHSDFGQHAKNNGRGAHNEGDHRGWSSCIPGNPNAGFTR